MRLTAEQRELVERHMPLAESMARWRAYGSDDPDDVRSDALYGLTQAARRYDRSRGPFPPAARFRIEGAIRRGRQIRSGIARAAWDAGERTRPASLNAPVGENAELGDLVEHPGHDIDSSLDTLAVTQALERLDDREHEVITLRYLRDWSQSRVAARIGVSQMRVSRIERAALGTLHAAMT